MGKVGAVCVMTNEIGTGCESKGAESLGGNAIPYLRPEVEFFI